MLSRFPLEHLFYQKHSEVYHLTMPCPLLTGFASKSTAHWHEDNARHLWTPYDLVSMDYVNDPLSVDHLWPSVHGLCLWHCVYGPSMTQCVWIISMTQCLWTMDSLVSLESVWLLQLLVKSMTWNTALLWGITDKVRDATTTRNYLVLFNVLGSHTQ
jgi:hypothetical protein